MADEADEKGANDEAKPSDASEGEGKSKKKGSKRAIVISIILIVDIAFMAGIAFFIVRAIRGDDPAVIAMKEEQESARKKMEMISNMGTVLEAPMKFTVNIAGGEEPHYLKCEVQLEWDGVNHLELAAELEKRMAKVKDIIIKILSARTMNDILTAEGKEIIRTNIVKDINAILPKEKGELTNAYFTEFLIQ